MIHFIYHFIIGLTSVTSIHFYPIQCTCTDIHINFYSIASLRHNWKIHVHVCNDCYIYVLQVQLLKQQGSRVMSGTDAIDAGLGEWFIFVFASCGHFIPFYMNMYFIFMSPVTEHLAHTS